VNPLIRLAIAVGLGAYFVASTFHLKLVIATTEAQAEGRPTYKAAGLEGNLHGRILFDSDPPIRKRIDMSSDGNCAAVAKNPRTEDFIVADRGLANAFVYVKGGDLGRFVFEITAANAILDQQRCQFTPRVLGLQIKQTLVVLNSDPTTHNIHPSPLVNPEWNKMQEQYGTPIETQFMRSETMVPVKCNLHPWMRAYVGVLANPFFAVSSKDGTYSIMGMPPGDYTLVAWHEIAGEKTATFSIGPGEAQSVDLIFDKKPSGLRSHNIESVGSVYVD
jgi:hypothetical protein